MPSRIDLIIQSSGSDMPHNDDDGSFNAATDQSFRTNFTNWQKGDLLDLVN